jgi:CRP-like cAMP-binding protein
MTSVELQTIDDDAVFEILSTGETVGEMTLISNDPRNAAVGSLPVA